MTGQLVRIMKPDKMSHNMKIYWDSILYFIPNISLKDLRWMANKSANIYRDLGGQGSCIDNYRVSRIRLGKIIGSSIKYGRAEDSGCCGFYDQKHRNIVTGNSFLIGFNFGH